MSRTSVTRPRLGLLIAIALAGCETADAPIGIDTGRSYDHTTDHVVVTNTNNDGPGSLREAAFFATHGTLITFAPERAGQTIVVAWPIVPAAATFDRRADIAGDRHQRRRHFGGILDRPRVRMSR